MTFVTISKPIFTRQCPSERMARAVCLFALPLLPCPFFSAPQGDERCKLVSRELLFFGVRLGIAKQKALGERLEAGEEGRRQGISPHLPCFGCCPRKWSRFLLGSSPTLLPAPPTVPGPVRWFQCWDPPALGLVVASSYGDSGLPHPLPVPLQLLWPL